MDDKKLPLPKDIKATKASLLKKEHTEGKLARIFAKKMAAKNSKIGSGKRRINMRRCASEMRNRDIDVTSDREPINIKLKNATLGGFSASATKLAGKTAADTESNLDDIKNITARRATSKILRSLDSLIHDSKYKFKNGENPKFDLNKKQLKKKICDTNINEPLAIVKPD